MTEKENKENQSNESGGMSQEEARSIINSQVQILRRLNDELLRTAKLHVILGGGFVTVISLINPELFLPDTSDGSVPIGWIVGSIITSSAFISWYFHLGAYRISYTRLKLGVHPSIKNSDDQFIESDQSLLKKVREHYKGALGVISGRPLPTDYFEDQTERGKAETYMLSDDYLSAVESNNWFLQTREKYVNAVQTILSSMFYLMIFGLIIMVIL